MPRPRPSSRVAGHHHQHLLHRRIAPEMLNGVYGGSKAFVLAFTQSLQHELADKGLRVQAVLPGATATDSGPSLVRRSSTCRRRSSCRPRTWSTPPWPASIMAS